MFHRFIFIPLMLLSFFCISPLVVRAAESAHPLNWNSVSQSSAYTEDLLTDDDFDLDDSAQRPKASHTSFITVSLSREALSWGNHNLWDSSGFGYECNASFRRLDHEDSQFNEVGDEERDRGWWGIDLALVAPLGKYVNLTAGFGLYYNDLNLDDVEEAGTLVGLQFHSQKCLVGYGYHSLKGHYVQFGFKP